MNQKPNESKELLAERHGDASALSSRNVTEVSLVGRTMAALRSIGGTVLKGGSLAALDQAVMSLANFLIGLLYIHRSTQEEYGLFTLFTSVVILFSGFQNAVVNAPMVVLLPGLTKEERPTFIKTLFWGHLLAFLALGLLLLPVSKQLARFADGTDISLTVGVVFIFATAAFLCREFVRNYHYTELRPSRALLVDGFYAFLLLCLFGIVVKVTVLSANIGILCIGAACLASLIVAARAWTEIMKAPVAFQLVFRQTWKYSKWALIGVAASWLQQNTFVYLASTQGMQNVAVLAAARLFVTPLFLVSTGWGMYFKPMVSHLLAAGNHRKAMRLLVSGVGALTALLVVYMIVLMIGLKYFSANILPPKYQGLDGYILLWGTISFGGIIYAGLTNVLQALLEFKRLSYYGYAAAGTSAILGWALMPLWGLYGILAGASLSYIVIAVLCYLRVRHHFSLMQMEQAAG